jgi:polyferredoxin
MWKEGFLEEGALDLPKINRLYEQKSQHIVDKIKSRFKFNLKLIIVMAVVIPIIYFFMDALWEGVAIAVLLLATAWFSQRQIDRIKAVETGQNSYDYLKSFKSWLDSILLKNGSVIRFTYPIYFLIVMSMLFSSWSSQEELVNEVVQKFPDVTLIGDVPLIAWIITAVITVLMLVFSKKIYLFDVRLMYGRIFDKLDATIEEMETLRA